MPNVYRRWPIHWTVSKNNQHNPKINLTDVYIFTTWYFNVWYHEGYHEPTSHCIFHRSTWNVVKWIKAPFLNYFLALCLPRKENQASGIEKINSLNSEALHLHVNEDNLVIAHFSYAPVYTIQDIQQIFVSLGIILYFWPWLANGSFYILNVSEIKHDNFTITLQSFINVKPQLFA